MPSNLTCSNESHNSLLLNEEKCMNCGPAVSYSKRYVRFDDKRIWKKNLRKSILKEPILFASISEQQKQPLIPVKSKVIEEPEEYSYEKTMVFFVFDTIFKPEREYFFRFLFYFQNSNTFLTFDF